MNFTKEMSIQWLEKATELIKENKDYLTELDAAIGDADHGLNMDRGFSKVMEKMSSTEMNDCSDVFKNTAMTLISSVGGASGPLYGSFFLKASMACKGKSELNITDFVSTLEAAVKGVTDRGRAQIGDKTMIDVWSPVITALKEGNETDLVELMHKALKVAENAKEATRDLLAKKGRASYLGERSIGHLDPGAVSSTLIIEALDTIIDKNK